MPYKGRMQCAFSIIEFMVVVSIIGVLLAIFIPAFKRRHRHCLHWEKRAVSVCDGYPPHVVCYPSEKDICTFWSDEQPR